MSDVGWTQAELDEENASILRLLTAGKIDDVVDYRLLSDGWGGYEALVEIREDRWLFIQHYFNTREEAESFIAQKYPEAMEEIGWS